MDQNVAQRDAMPNPKPALTLMKNYWDRIRKKNPKLRKFSSLPVRVWAISSLKRKMSAKAYGDKLLMDGMSFSLPPGGIVGIIGPNGAGKSTLFKMITGQEKPDSGTIRIGDTVKLAYVDQSRDALDPDKTIWEMISDGQDIHHRHAWTVSTSRTCACRGSWTRRLNRPSIGVGADPDAGSHRRRRDAAEDRGSGRHVL